MSAILQRYWFVLLFLALVCVGCRGTRSSEQSAGERGAIEGGGGRAEAGETGEVPPADLEPGEVFAAEGYAEPAKQLMEELKAAYPGVEFSVGWTTVRLQVTIHEATASESSLARLTSDREALHHDIMECCFAVKAPRTDEIAVSSKSASGSAYTDQGAWDTYRQLLGAG